MKKRTSGYLRTDEKENTIDSLRRALDFLKNTEKDFYNWKWFIIAIHHAIHGFMIVALTNPNLSGIWEKEPAIRRSSGVVDIFSSKNRLVSFMKAFERIQDPTRMGVI